MIGAGLIYCGRLLQVASASWRWFWFTPASPFPLCALRVVVGLVAIGYFIEWAPDLQYWFGSASLLPPAVVRELLQQTDAAGNFYGWSHLNGISQVWLLNGAHAFAVLVAAAFTLGIYTRISSIVLWLLLLSYVQRAPMLKTQLDPLLTMSVAYLCLAPAGACLSWDAWRRRVIRDSEQPEAAARTADSLPMSISANLAQRLFQVHLTAYYLLFALSKLGGATWWQGDAVGWLAAQPDSPALASGLWMQSNAWFSVAINVATHAIVATELAYPLLIWNRWTRPLAMLAASVVWLVIALLTGRILFCLLMIGLQLAFFEGRSPFPSQESLAGTAAYDDGLPE